MWLTRQNKLVLRNHFRCTCPWPIYAYQVSAQRTHLHIFCAIPPFLEGFPRCASVLIVFRRRCDCCFLLSGWHSTLTDSFPVNCERWSGNKKVGGTLWKRHQKKTKKKKRKKKRNFDAVQQNPMRHRRFTQFCFAKQFFFFRIGKSHTYAPEDVTSIFMRVCSPCLRCFLHVNKRHQITHVRVLFLLNPVIVAFLCIAHERGKKKEIRRKRNSICLPWAQPSFCCPPRQLGAYPFSSSFEYVPIAKKKKKKKKKRHWLYQ